MITFKLDNKSVVLDNLKSASFHFVLSPYNNETSDRIFKFTCSLNSDLMTNDFKNIIEESFNRRDLIVSRTNEDNLPILIEGKVVSYNDNMIDNILHMEVVGKYSSNKD